MHQISKTTAEALRNARGEEAQILLKSGSFKYVRFAIRGSDLPNINRHQDDLAAGILIGELIVNRIVRKVLAVRDMRQRFVDPFFNPKSLKYILEYIRIHGIQVQTPVINRTDMLLNSARRLNALEVNSDSPEGYAFTHTSDDLQQILHPGRKRSGMWQFFHFAYKRFLTEIEKLRGEAKAVIPYWSGGSLTETDAVAKALDLRNAGFDVVARPADSLKNPAEFNCVIRSTASASSSWKRNADLPIFTEPSFLALPMYPAPWTDIGGLKHWFALLQLMLSDTKLASQFGITQDEIRMVSAVLSPTFGPPHHSIEEVMDLFQSGPSRWIAKEIFSSHGAGFHCGEDMIAVIKSGQAVLQKKVECYKTGAVLILHPDGSIREEADWFVDINPLGMVPGEGVIALGRTCPAHPMNVAGENGGGAFNPYYY